MRCSLCNALCGGQHYDDAPFRWYCQLCAGCKSTRDGFLGDDVCDGCWNRHWGYTLTPYALAMEVDDEAV